ncbi:FMN-binding negative transcriptional regulator [Priestia megaterium]|uniref:FMN-binding negative transcriptional regulator n=1 Tax=Priestia megaterium TaxID=1404 RepID=UPI00159C8C97|nr:FMN-binding negative transcriptional regulator [Priestia megaterium]
MYIPKYFKIEDDQIIYDFIEKNGFATLFSQHNGKPYATHLPLTLNKDEGVLYGHFARPNQQWKDSKDQDILVVFQGPHCYISPSWYETNQAVPTWNYVAIHVYGQIDIVEDNQELINSVTDMVTKYEAPNSPYKLNEIDAKYINGMSKGIVGFKIKIKKIEGKWKLSQNHSIERQKLVIQQLEQHSSEDDKQIAYLMKKNLQNNL